jgi:hypothetical protein
MQSAPPSAETPAASGQVRPPIIQERVVHHAAAHFERRTMTERG